MDRFLALRIHTVDGAPQMRFDRLALSDLDEGNVVIRTAYAGVGYRDAMAAKGVGNNIRTDRPCVGGVDMSGIVETSTDSRYRPGDQVIVTNFSFGNAHDGAFAEYVRVPAAWVVPLPGGLTMREAMVLGSSGLTAALAFDRLEAGGLSNNIGPVIVTGSTGGVGSIAVDILARRGYVVVAATGKSDAVQYLREIGASDVVPRSSLLGEGKILGAMRWAGAVDNLGGSFLDRIASNMLPNGKVAVCGLAASSNVTMTVLPFILRGIDFLGIHIGRNFSMQERLRIWSRLASDLKPLHLDRIINTIPFSDLPEVLGRMYDAAIVGRVVVEIAPDIT